MGRFLVLAFLLTAVPARAQDVMALVHAQHWAEADAAASGYADPVVGKLVAYYRMQTPGAATLGEIEAFRSKNPDWPQQAVLRQRRDEALIAEPDDAVAAAACDREPPHAAPALARCADAYQRQNRPEEAAAAVRAAWVAAAPNASWEADFFHRWATVLTAADQYARFDRLAWGDTSAASRQLQHLAPDDRKSGEARLALRRDDPKAAALVAGLSQKALADPAIMLERARWLRRANRDAEALALWQADGAAAERAAPPDRRAAFWEERNILARRLLRAGDADGAYALASGAVQTAPEQVADADFLAGWIALRRLGDPARAAAHFGAIELVSSAAITQARAHYWLARAASAQGDADWAQRENRAAAAYPSTFYGQLAARATGEETATLAARIAQHGREPAWSVQRATLFASRELARAAIYLAAWGEPGRASAFLLRLGDGSGDAADMALAARLATAFGLPQTAIAIARQAGRAGVVLLEYRLAGRGRPAAGQRSRPGAGAGGHPTGEQLRSRHGQPGRRARPDAADARHRRLRGPRPRPAGLRARAHRRRELQYAARHGLSARVARAVRWCDPGRGRRLQRRTDARLRVAGPGRRPARKSLGGHDRLDRADPVQRNPQLRAARDREHGDLSRPPRRIGPLGAAVATLARMIASGLGAGCIPIAPGTAASAFAAAVAAGLLAWSPLALAGAAAMTTVLGFWAIRAAGAKNDPGWVVIDEIAGQFVAMLPLTRPSWPGVLLALALFRLLDIAKPGPIGWADRATGSVAVMADDLLAGGIAAAVLWAIRRGTMGLLDW